MLKNYLPNDIYNALSKVKYQNLCELRLRADSYVVVNILGENYYLCSDTLSRNKDCAIKVNKSVLQSILQKISNNSMYTINDELINGYTTISGGIRVGVCGETVCVDNKIKTIKNISSLNFRFPHFVKNCSLNIYPYIVRDGYIKNTLIISPPGAGKTTYLRDIIYQLNNKENLINILVIDERQELSQIYNGDDIVKLNNIDIISNSTKKFGFNNGIRSMKPDVIITDEINVDKDLDDIENAITSGVSIIATLHASSIMDIKNKSAFKNILNKRLFDRYVFLSSNCGVGTLEGVYDENLICIGV